MQESPQTQVDEITNSVKGLTVKIKNLGTEITTKLSFAGLVSTITDAVDKLSDFQDKNISATRSLGQNAQLAKSIEGELGKAALNVVKMGGKLEDVITTYKSINNELSRTTYLSELFLSNARAIKTFGVDDKTINSFAKFFDKVGGGMDASIDKQIELVNTAQKYGLNTGQFLTTVAGKLDLLTKYGFPKGVNDLASMVAKSQVLGDTLSVASSFADSIMDSPEKAYEYAAQLQTLGGSFSQLGDGAQLLYMAQNDLSGLNDQIIKATRGIATFNKETGQFEISASERGRLRALKNLGIEADKIEEAALKLAKNEKILSEFKGIKFDGISDEDKQTLANISEIGKGGEIKIAGKKINDLDNNTIETLLKTVQNQGGQLKEGQSNIDTVQKQFSANERITTTTNELNNMLASTIIATDNWSKRLDDSAGEITKVTGAIVTTKETYKNKIDEAFTKALEASNKIISEALDSLGFKDSKSNMAPPVDTKETKKLEINITGLDLKFIEIIKPAIIQVVEENMKKSGYSK